MNTKEKILLVQLILEDIRGNWAYEAEDRAVKAKELCKELAKETGSYDYEILADYCDTYISSSKKWDDWDGRFFRQRFPMGYEGMDKLHHLKPRYLDKSRAFKELADKYLTHPEYRFDDWANVML